MTDNDHVFVIAEAGVNHLGNLETAKAMAQVAKDAGADAVKFQLWTEPLGGPPEVQALLQRCELEPREWEALCDFCGSIEIEWMVSCFDVGAVDFAVGNMARRLKIPSGEITNVPLLQAAGATGLPVILSTGASNEQEIRDAYNAIRHATPTTPNIRLTGLHCVSAYPTPVDQCQLELGFEALVGRGPFTWWGWSDHTAPGTTVAAVAAVALGADVVERHFRGWYPNEKMWRDDGIRPANPESLGDQVPDHAVSDAPGDLVAYVQAIRDAEAAIASYPDRVPLQIEQAVRQGARRDPTTGRRPVQ